MLVARGVALIVGYICGLFLTGFFIGKLVDVDLTTKGSGNVGTTNTIRILGLPMGAMTLVGDMLKGIIPAFIIYFVYRNASFAGEGIALLMEYACFGAILGHDFPIYMLKKGGKGVATSTAMVLVCFPRALPLLILVFALIVFFTRYVSLGSISVAVLYSVEVILFAILGWLYYFYNYKWEALVLVILASVLCVWKHCSNIKRLLSGTENMFSFHPNN
jgi:glycerol-3-phosphate acyltransferase PlsY